jgi:hypothetical protein
MNEILELLTAALNKMLLKQQEAAALVSDTQALKVRMDAKMEDLRQIESALTRKMSELGAREVKIRQIENFEKEKQELGIKAGALQVRENNLRKSEKEVSDLKASLADRSKAIEDRELALSREKEAFKERIKKEIYADVASGKIKLTVA